MKTTLKQLFSKPFHVLANGQMILITRPGEFRKEDVLKAIYHLPTEQSGMRQFEAPTAEFYTPETRPQIKRQLLVTITPESRIAVIPLAVTPLDTHGLRPNQWLQKLLPANFQFTMQDNGVAVSDEQIQGEQLLDLVDAFESNLDAYQATPFTTVIEQLAGVRPVTALVQPTTAKVRTAGAIETRQPVTA